MSDGREFTSYHAACNLNTWLQEKYNIKDSHQYRQFLQANAEKVMKDLAECDPKSECVLCPVCKLALDPKHAH